MDEQPVSPEIQKPQDWHKLLGTGAAVASALAAVFAVTISLMPGKNDPSRGAQVSAPRDVVPSAVPSAPPSVPPDSKLDSTPGNSSSADQTQPAPAPSPQSTDRRIPAPPDVTVPIAPPSSVMHIQTVPPPTPLAAYIGKSGNNQVKVHNAASHDSETIDMLDPGDRVRIISQPQDWFLVQTPHNKRGFVHQEFIVFSPPETGAATQADGADTNVAAGSSLKN